MLMMKVILSFYHKAQKALEKGISAEKIIGCGWVEKIVKIKYDIPNDKLEMFDDYEKEMADDFEKLEVC